MVLHSDKQGSQEFPPTRRVTRGAKRAAEEEGADSAPMPAKRPAKKAAPAPKKQPVKAAAKKQEKKKQSKEPKKQQDEETGLPKFPEKQVQPLTPEALTALSNQNARSYDEHLKQIRYDDRIADIASTRGLLIKFTVKPLRTYQQHQDPIIVEAPEFMTVEYLKRRIMRAKLFKKQFLSPSKFALKRRAPEGSGSEMEDVASKERNGDEIFLAALGFEAPNEYELFLTSAPVTTDREQQEQILAPAVGSEATGRGPVSPVRAAYQAALRGTQAPKNTSHVPRQPLQQQQQPQRVQQQPAPPVQQQQHVNASAIAHIHHGDEAAASGAGHAETTKPRRTTEKWTTDEVYALIQGVQAYGTCWAQIYDRYVGPNNRINERRTQVDLKDKWRNLVKAARQPGKARSREIEENRDTILRLSDRHGVPTTASPLQRPQPQVVQPFPGQQIPQLYVVQRPEGPQFQQVVMPVLYE